MVILLPSTRQKESMKIFIYNHNTAGKHFLNTNIEFNVKIFTALWISIITFDGIQEPTLTIELLGDPLNEYDEKERERNGEIMFACTSDSWKTVKPRQ